MTTWQSLKARILHWKTVPVLASLGNLVFEGFFVYVITKSALAKKDMADEIGLAFFGLLVLFNLFALVNIFFDSKLGVRLFLTVIFGFDAIVSGAIALLLVYLVSTDDDFRTSINHFLTGALLLVFVLSVCSAFLALRNMDPTDRAGN